jgi:hypothetical protein
MIRLFKGLVILGVLLCFTLGALAVSFAAHDSAAPWPLVTAGLQRLPAEDATQLIPYALGFGIRSGSVAAPNPSRPDSKDVPFAHTFIAEPMGGLSKTTIHRAKVSLQIFELVLLL